MVKLCEMQQLSFSTRQTRSLHHLFEGYPKLRRPAESAQAIPGRKTCKYSSESIICIIYCMSRHVMISPHPNSLRYHSSMNATYKPVARCHGNSRQNCCWCKFFHLNSWSDGYFRFSPSPWLACSSQCLKLPCANNPGGRMNISSEPSQNKTQTAMCLKQPCASRLNQNISGGRMNISSDPSQRIRSRVMVAPLDGSPDNKTEKDCERATAERHQLAIHP